MISIVVMLILAGVSLNATVGDNGILTRARQATRKNSMAILEEFLQEEYVGLKIDDDGNMEGLDLLRKYHDGYFFKPTQTGLTYVLLDGHKYFLINKDGLPDDIKKQLVGGDAGEKTYQDYINFKDVYGITTDLKVYYCENGLESRIGAEDELLSDDATRVAIPSNSSSGMASYLTENFDWIKTDAAGNILSDGMSAQKELTIDSNKVKNFDDLYNFSGLKKLYIKNANLQSFSGLELCPLLEYVYIYNTTSESFEQLANISKLKYLYFEGTSQDTIDKCMNDLKDKSLGNLEYFGIYNSTVTSIAKFDNLSSETKSKVHYMDFHGSHLVNFTGLENCTGLISLTAYSSYITSLNGISCNSLTTLYISSNGKLNDFSVLNNATKLKSLRMSTTLAQDLNFLENSNNIEYIEAQNCKIGQNTENESNKSTKNALYALRNKNSIYYLNLENNSDLIHVDYIKDNPTIKQLYLAGCNLINPAEATYLKTIIRRCGLNYSLPTNLGLALLDDTITTLDIKDQTISVEQFDVIGTYSGLKYVCLMNVVIKNGTTELTAEEYNEKINSTLAKLTNLETINLNGISKLSKINFVTSCKNITEIDARNTNITTDENGLQLLNNNCEKLKTLAINNENDDLSKIQGAINKMDRYGIVTGSWQKYNTEVNGAVVWGLYCTNQTALNTLVKCKDLERFYCGSHIRYTIDLSACTRLKDVGVYLSSNGKVKLPTEATIDASILEEQKKGIHTYDNDKATLSYKLRLTDVYDNAITGGYGCNSISLTHPYVSSNESFWNLMSGFRNSDKLESIYFGFTSTTNATYINSLGLEVFSNCSNLKSIEWRGRTVTPYIGNADNLSPLSNMRSLEKITFDYITASKIPDLSQLYNLKTVDITTSMITDINGLKNCTSIETLTLKNNNIQDISAVGTLRNLKSLNLENNSITNAVTTVENGFVNNVEVLNRLKGTLKLLYIANNNFDDLSQLQWANSK